MKIVLSPNPYRDRGLRAAQAAGRILKAAGVETVLCLPFPILRNHIELPQHLHLGDIHKELRDADMLICFGGDGTILHAAKDANACNVPILGVNMGSVGFMAELEQSELPLLNRIAVGKYTTEPRMLLDVVVRRDGRTIYSDMALNDAVFTKGATARMVDLEIYGDNTLIYQGSADGAVVSTPTGSTAYSMAAGGPIVEPTAENIIITPICPHVLSARAVVLDGERIVSVKTGRNSRKMVYLSVDGGKGIRLNGGDTVEIQASSSKIQLVRLTNRTFYEILSHKLGGA